MENIQNEANLNSINEADNKSNDIPENKICDKNLISNKRDNKKNKFIYSGIFCLLLALICYLSFTYVKKEQLEFDYLMSKDKGFANYISDAALTLNSLPMSKESISKIDELQSQLYDIENQSFILYMEAETKELKDYYYNLYLGSDILYSMLISAELACEYSSEYGIAASLLLGDIKEEADSFTSYVSKAVESLNNFKATYKVENYNYIDFTNNPFMTLSEYVSNKKVYQPKDMKKYAFDTYYNLISPTFDNIEYYFDIDLNVDEDNRDSLDYYSLKKVRENYEFIKYIHIKSNYILYEQNIDDYLDSEIGNTIFDISSGFGFLDDIYSSYVDLNDGGFYVGYFEDAYNESRKAKNKILESIDIIKDYKSNNTK
ncbi:MAG: hypothetical protein IJ086_15795 [Clostridium sp.]|nr:hypothetical protein [Clostridium sp.]MBQ9000137.1 hypothetical protein [Clostridium sp.]